MKISTNSRYALRFLLQVAAGNGRYITTAAAAEAEGISTKMLERIAAKLGHAGLVESSKGIGGGYRLARPASEITVTDILLTMETPYLPHHCTDDPAGCRRYCDCRLLPLWEEIEASIRAVTDCTTIASLLHR